MTIVMISSTHHDGGEKLVHSLSQKTNWPVVTREEAADKAREWGIKLGRLEVSMIKTPGATEKLAKEKEMYLAFITSMLCDKAREGNFIYYGRSGHLLLPGVSNRLRVGLTAPKETRIENAARTLRMTPEKAETFLDQLDDDVGKWNRYVHTMDGRNPICFDVFFNMENIGFSNAASVLCSMAELPDFQPTPASTKLLNDLSLTARAKLRLALDEKTNAAHLLVRADDGIVTVIYPPNQQEVERHISTVLNGLEGCRRTVCTMADTKVLWVQERFDPDSDNFAQIKRLAERWGAAVELLRLLPPSEYPDQPVVSEAASEEGPTSSKMYDGGVQDDEPISEQDDGGLHRTQEELVDLGCYGGSLTVTGGYEQILERVQGNSYFTMVVIGDVYLSKGHSTRTRKTRELALNIRDRLKTPVITSDELKTRFLFGKQQAFRLIAYFAVVAFLYAVVFTNQAKILNWVGGDAHQNTKWLTAVGIALFVPAIAYIYGTVTGLALKIINID